MPAYTQTFHGRRYRVRLRITEAGTILIHRIAQTYPLHAAYWKAGELIYQGTDGLQALRLLTEMVPKDRLRIGDRPFARLIGPQARPM